jgi:hypothetical protein
VIAPMLQRETAVTAAAVNTVTHNALATPAPLPCTCQQPGDPAPRGDSYIAASYVKWIEVRMHATTAAAAPAPHAVTT